MTHNSVNGEPGSGDFGLLSPQWAGTPVADATSDAAVLRAMLEVECALVDAWVACGFAPQSAADAVRDTVAHFSVDVEALAAESRAGGNPVIAVVGLLRAAVADRDGAAAVWLHRGLTSQDVLDSALMLVARRVVDIVAPQLAAVCASVAALARDNRSTIMVSRTLSQHGVPSTFGVKAAGWLAGVSRAALRLNEVEFPVQWGGAGGTLASFDAVGGGPSTGLAVSDAAAEILGLARSLPWHTQRSPVAELGAALAQVAGALGKVAVDVVTLGRPEIAELCEPSAAGRGGSSAMPQKQNPVLSVLINSSAQRAPFLAAQLQLAMIAVDERPDGAWHSEWASLRELLRLVGGAVALAEELTAGLTVDAEAMRRNLELSGPLVVSERLMLELGAVVGRERLQLLVSRVVADRSLSLASLLRAEPSLASLDDASLAALLDPAQYLGESELIVDRVLERFAEGGGLR